MASFTVTWQAPEFQYREKDVSWYWISIIVVAAIIAFAIWQRNFLFGVFMIIAEILLIVWANAVPKVFDFTLSENGLQIGEAKDYRISLFESFSVNRLNEEWTELFFTFKAKLRTPAKVLIPTEKVDELRKNLRPILREVDYDPSLIDSLEKIIGF